MKRFDYTHKVEQDCFVKEKRSDRMKMCDMNFEEYTIIITILFYVRDV